MARTSHEELRKLVSEENVKQLSESLESLDASERIYAFSHMDREEGVKLVQMLSSEEAARLLGEMPEDIAAGVLDRSKLKTAASILEQLPSDDQTDLIRRLDVKRQESLLGFMGTDQAKQARHLLSFPENTAGGLMITEYLNYHEEMTVADVLDDMRANAIRYSDFDVQYAYITGNEGQLSGVLRFRDLLFARKDAVIGDMMIRNPASIRVTARVSELPAFFEEHGFLAAPVVDGRNRLIGVVQREAVREAMAKAAAHSFLQSYGIVGGEELRSMPLKIRSRRRLAWLSINIFLNLIAASVIAFYQDTLAQVIALAIFLPVISDMSGCSGNQAVAVSIRELSLGVIKPRDYLRVFWKESAVGLINGAALGLMIGVIAALWQQNLMLGIVVGAALAINTLVAVCFGGVVPLLIKRMKQDPALVSGPLLTTITDMCGFFFVLGIASMVLDYLV